LSINRPSKLPGRAGNALAADYQPMPLPRVSTHQSARTDRRPRFARIALTTLTIGAGTALAVGPATAAPAKHRHHRRHRPAHAAPCAGANAQVGRASAQLLRAAVVCLIDNERTLHHLPPLHASRLLDRSAQGWTNAMVSSDEFTHGANFAARISGVGYRWRMAGENIATGFATPRAVVRAWMASAAHCENILNPTYENVGTGVSPRTVRGWANRGGTWTQDFALGMHQSARSANFGPTRGCPY
jgi:uncharacterized protein YkwD